MIRPFYTLLFTLFSISVFAQTNYHTGYIVKNNGDTVKGMIDYREWTRTPAAISFSRGDRSAATEIYNAHNIKGFGVDGMETYITYTGPVSMNKNEYPNLPIKLDTAKMTDTIFLRQVQQGRYLALYSNTDAIKSRYFIAEQNGRPVELLYSPYFDDNKQVVNSATYQGQLVQYAGRYNAANEHVLNDIKNATFNEKYISQLVSEINGDSTWVKQASTTRVFIGAAASYHYGQENGVDGNNSPRTSSSVVPKINLGIDFFNNAYVQKYAFRIELSAYSVSPKYFYSTTYSGANAVAIYQYTQFNFAITPQFVLNVYNTASFKFYLDAGIGLNFSGYSNDKYALQNSPLGAPEKDEPYALSAFWLNYPLQAGMVLNKKIELFVNYTLSTNLFSDLDSPSNGASFYVKDESVNAGIKFWIK